MKLKSAPREFVSAIACFLDDRIAGKALGILANDSDKDAG
jgi:hypothetical protein